jgi:hypothetical protein
MITYPECAGVLRDLSHEGCTHLEFWSWQKRAGS